MGVVASHPEEEEVGRHRGLRVLISLHGAAGGAGDPGPCRVAVRYGGRIPVIRDDRRRVGALRGHVVEAGDQPLEPPLLALGDLGGRPAGAQPVVVEAFEDVGARPADRLGIESELCPGRDRGIEGDGEEGGAPVVGMSDGVSGGLHAEDIQVAGVQGERRERSVERPGGEG